MIDKKFSEFKVLVLISGRGSNLAALLKNQRNYTIQAVLSDKEAAPGLELARDNNVRVVAALPAKNFSSKAEQKAAIYAKISEINPDLICLAGFMQIVEGSFVRANYGKIINIHPSLLPKFTGLHTHSRALQAGETIHGCTVHFVDEGLDSGPVIVQASCPVLENDTEDSLAARVLSKEHQIYPWVVENIAGGDIKLIRQQNQEAWAVQYSDQAVQSAKKLNFSLKA